MKYNVTEIKFDFDEGDIDDPITFEEQVQIIHDNLGVWEADDEDDLIEEITTSSGWCIKSIDYNIQLKQGYDRSISVTSAGCFIASDDYNNNITNEFHYD